MDIYVARQPIFDTEYKVVAYELLYRDSFKNSYEGHLSGNIATSILLVNSFLNFGIDNLVDNKKAFINFDESLLAQGVAELLDKEQVVIEILETVNPDKKVIDKIEVLQDNGYILALDDMVTDYAHDVLVDLVSIIKIDFIESTKAELLALVRKYKKLDKVLLAEKVETVEEYNWAKEVGFTYFQGYFFAKPEVKKMVNLSSNAIQFIKLFHEMNKKEPNFDILAETIELDIGLTIKILKLVNNLAGPLSEFKTIKQVLAFLGVKAIRKWLSLAAIQGMASPETLEITKYAMIRFSFLKEIALNSRLKEHVEELTLIGILSIIDKVFNKDIEEILEDLPLEINVKNTLLDIDNILYPAYKLCLEYEKGNFESSEKYSKEIDYEFSLSNKHYVESIKWANEVFSSLNKFNE